MAALIGAGLQGVLAGRQVLIPFKASWTYLDTGSEPGDDWTRMGFDDSAWKTGWAELGYGDGDEATAVGFGLDGANKFVTTWFRRSLTLVDPVLFSSIELSLIYDDGAIVYINGVEVHRINMPLGPIVASTLASVAAADPLARDNVSIPPGVLVAGTNLIAVEVHQVALDSSDLSFDLELSGGIDDEAPSITGRIPEPGEVAALTSIEVRFNEAVQGVEAGDLLINGQPATGLTVGVPGQFVFTFPPPATGAVQVAFSPGHGIADLAVRPNAFAGDSWSYTVNPLPPAFRISEFMAVNVNTLNDNYGNKSDWIEIYNPGAAPGNLAGWYLTDDVSFLTKWRFPSRNIDPNGYVVVFASGSNQTVNPAFLHTNFRLSDGGEFLALVDPDLNIVSAFSPAYPRQVADVSYGRDQLDPSVTGYFLTPTPGARNSISGWGIGPEVVYSRDSGTFPTNQAFDVALSTPGVLSRIYYSFGTNVPGPALGAKVFEYTGPIRITNTTAIRARAFVEGLLPGPVVSRTFIGLSTQTNVLGFNSRLPILVLHNYGQGVLPADSTQEFFAYLQTFEDGCGGLTSMTNPPRHAVRVRMHTRGSSTLTASSSKASFFLETEDEYDEHLEVPLLGMPAEADWVLWAPNNFEPALFHNPLAMQLARDGGEYAPRSRFVELFLKDDGGTRQTPAPPGAISSTGFAGGNGDYHGIYVLMERIKRDDNRLRIAKLEPEHVQVPEVTGGYLVSIDRTDPGKSTFTAGGTALNPLEPGWNDWTNAVRAPQRAYITGYLNAFANGLSGANLTNAILPGGAINTNHYSYYINVDSWVRRHVHEVLSFNVDALRLGGYLFKDRSKKLEYGPPWDFDRSQGSTDGRDANPRTWRSTAGDLGTDFFNFTPWWATLFRAPDFWQAWIDRYQTQRQPGGALTTTIIHARIDQFYEELRDAQPRERMRWNIATRGTNGIGSGTYLDEVTWKKHWYNARLNFMDTNFLAMPALRSGPPGGGLGTDVSLIPASKPGSWVIYTLDGRDPRLPNGGIAPGAHSNLGPATVSLAANARIVARSFNSSHRNLTGPNNPPISSPWSAPRTLTVRAGGVPLRVTEIMYHPLGESGLDLSAEEFQFIEFRNVGRATVPLGGMRFVRGIDFIFPSMALGPGEYAVVVRNRTAFEARYGTGLPVAGEFGGALSLSGERLTLVDATDEVVLDFAFSDSWHDLTDGPGLSLVAASDAAPLAAFSTRTGWRGSRLIHGSPGRPEPDGWPVSPVMINEVLSNPVAPFSDSVEFFNPSASAANIAYWYLTDNYGEPRKFRFPVGTVIPGLGLLAIDETAFNTDRSGLGIPFAFSEEGDAIYLYSADERGALTGYVHGFRFGPARTNETFGRQVLADGSEQFVVQARATLGEVNAGFAVTPVGLRPTLAITEIHFEPGPLPSDMTNDPAESEFVELRNVGTEPIELGGAEFSAGISFVFPPLVLAPGQYTVVVRNRKVFAARYGTAVPVAGEFLGGLAADGEQLTVRSPIGDVLVDFAFVAEPFPLARGAGFAIVLRDENVRPVDPGDPSAWRHGAVEGGSPGRADPAAASPVHINEVFVWGEGIDASIAIELHNPGTGIVDVGGWMVVGDQRKETPAFLPAWSILPPGGYLVANVSLPDIRDRRDDGVHARLDLYSRDPTSGRLTGFLDTFDFGPGFVQVPFGPYVDGLGRRQNVPLTTPTLGAANAGPQVGPIILSEIQYRPPDIYARGAWLSNTCEQFIELRNVSGGIVRLSDGAPFSALDWMIGGSVAFEFPAGFALPPGGTCVVVAFDPGRGPELERFRGVYGVPTGVPILGPWRGDLGRSGSIRLIYGGSTGEWGVRDPVDYGAGQPWPPAADGLGLSLHRVNELAYANDPAVWRVATPSPGAALVPEVRPMPVVVRSPRDATNVVGGTTEFSVVASGAPDLAYRWFFNRTIIPGATNPALRLEDLKIGQSGRYEVLVSGGDRHVLSDSAYLEVLQGATIVSHPTPVSVRVRPDPAAAPTTNVLFQVGALTEYPPLSYQWHHNGRLIPGATNSSLLITDVSTNHWGAYSCAVTDGLGTVRSTEALLNPIVQVGFLQLPVTNLVVVPGSRVALSCVVTGYPPPYVFEWRRGSIPVVRTTNLEPFGILTLVTTNGPSTNQYRVVVTHLSNPSPGVGSNPQTVVITAVDTDGDGLPDLREDALPGFDKNNPLDALGDDDGDGMTNGDEWVAGTDPRDPQSYLRLELPFGVVPGLEVGPMLSFTAISNRVYAVEAREGLEEAGLWRKVAEVPALGMNRVVTVQDRQAPGVTGQQIYRLVTPRQ